MWQRNTKIRDYSRHIVTITALGNNRNTTQKCNTCPLVPILAHGYINKDDLKEDPPSLQGHGPSDSSDFSSGCAVGWHLANAYHQAVCSLCDPQTALWVRQWFSLANLFTKVQSLSFSQGCTFLQLAFSDFWCSWTYRQLYQLVETVPFNSLLIIV